jgi:hypothetical protein
MAGHHDWGTRYAGIYIPDSINPLIQKGKTYRILSAKYEEKKAKYDKATPAEKETAEYKRLENIVLRLRGTLKQMEVDMAR